MKFTTTYKIEDFILDASWDKLPSEVKERLRGCFIDLMGALIAGTASEQFRVGLSLASRIYGKGDIAVVGSRERFCFMGASAAMGHSSNAYDIDDGHNMTRSHPGTSFVGAVLAAAYEKNLSLADFLCAMLVAYEVSLRSGAAIMDYYNFAHSSGTFGAVGVAAGVGKIYGFDRAQLNNVLSVAEFNAPLVPGIRSVEYPSMNKDGVPFGVMVGALAIMDTLCGFTGNKNLLESDEYSHYADDIGQKYEVMGLYFKPYPCCRWGHPAIDACVDTMRKNGIRADEIEKVVISTFDRATRLSKIKPKTADEAQYNIAYPVAAAIVTGDFGMNEVMEENMSRPDVLEMMDRLSFEVDERLDSLFPAKRICRAQIYTKDGREFVSEECEPRGEAHENIGIDWLCDKFYRITSPFISKECQQKLTNMICGDENISIRDIVDASNDALFEKTEA